MAVSTRSNPKITQAEKNIAALLRKKVLVGIPGSAGAHAGSNASNALIGYVQEFGDAEKNIPPRPFLVPGVAANRDKIVGRLKAAAQAACKGDLAKADAEMRAIGLESADSARAKLLSGPFAPLAQSTIEARARTLIPGTGKLSRAGSSKNARRYLELQAQGVPTEVLNDPDVGLARPLIVTGELMRSITFIVKG